MTDEPEWGEGESHLPLGEKVEAQFTEKLGAISDAPRPKMPVKFSDVFAGPGTNGGDN